MPAFNAERFIAQAIKSVLNQTFSDFELIITDDGSTDRTVEIAQSFNDPRITVISDGENKGISYRLNQQIDLAKGKYFARMDADDIMFSDRIEFQVNFLRAHPDIDLIGGGAIIIDDNSKIIGKREINKKCIKLTPDEIRKGNSFIHPTVMGKVEFFKNFGYCDKYKGVEDVYLWHQSCNNCNLYILQKKVLFYRDPLKYKISTFLFRSKQSRKLLRDPDFLHIYERHSKFKRLFKNYIQTIIVPIISFLGLDAFLIKRRNQRCNDSKSYNTILETVLSDKE